jgi:undecaprenyl-diphosphatase
MIFQAILLGIIEGLTEFLPISSTGHLIVAEKMIGYKDTAELFTVVIQVGAIFAVLWHYRVQLLEITHGLFKRDKDSLRFWMNWIIATIPVGILGILLSSRLSDLATLPVIAAALLIGGILILLIEKYHRPPTNNGDPKFNTLKPMQSFKVGWYQTLSLIPGMSRSGATIMGGVMSGLDRVTATAFSFYMSIPVLLLAGSYKLIKEGDKINTVTGGSAAIIAGTITTFIVSLMAINWLLKYVSSHSFKIFAYYRIVFGSLIFIAIAIS